MAKRKYLCVVWSISITFMYLVDDDMNQSSQYETSHQITTT